MAAIAARLRALPTEAGKTRVALAALFDSGLPTAILCPTKALAVAWMGELQGHLAGKPIGLIGYWTKEYLANKRAMMHAARVPLVMCVDERHADSELREDPRVLVFKKRIDVHALLRACGRMVAS